MGTYHNAYDILTDVREALNEADTALIQGTATYGKFSNTFLVKRINRSVRAIYSKLMLLKHVREKFLASASITGSNSAFALPWDVGVIRRFEDDQGVKVDRANIDHKPIQGGSGSSLTYYRQGNNLVLTKSGVSSTYTLYYLRKPRELDVGAAASANTLASSAKAIADYYNGMVLENTTDDTIHTISDYTAARVVTLDTGSLATDEYYGIVSDLPEPFHHLISPLAAMFAKAEHPVSPESPKSSAVQLWQNELEDAVLGFAGRELDIPEESIWSDNDDVFTSQGVIIPGHSGMVF
jgi:hypothetical protein